MQNMQKREKPQGMAPPPSSEKENHALTREQEVARALQRLREDPFRLGVVEIMEMIYDEWTNLSRQALAQQAQELEQWKHRVEVRGGFIEIDDCRAKATLYDAMAQEVERLKESLKALVKQSDANYELYEATRNENADLKHQLAAMTAERDEARAEERQEREDKVKWQHKCSLVPFWVFDYLNKKIPVMTIPEQLAASQARARELEAQYAHELAEVNRQKRLDLASECDRLRNIIRELQSTLAARDFQWSDELAKALPGLSFMSFVGPESTAQWVGQQLAAREARIAKLENDDYYLLWLEALDREFADHNYQCLLAEQREHAKALKERDTARQDAARLRMLIFRLLNDLPTKLDWLDPDLEKALKGA